MCGGKTECFVLILLIFRKYRVDTVQLSCSYRVGFVYKQCMNVEDCVLQLQMSESECVVLK